MKDVQSEYDKRNIPIDKVGVKNLKYPIIVKDRYKTFQNTVANINMYVNLSHKTKVSFHL